MTRIAINGFGRIGRCVLRALTASGRTDLEVVAINDLTSADMLAHLLRYDSVHGRFGVEVESSEGKMKVAGKDINVTSDPNPANLPWKDIGVDIVLECSGFFREKGKAMAHIEAGAKRVVISAPGKGVDGTFCYGVNHEQFDAKEHVIVSNASCTTNCLAPVAKVVNDTFKIQKGFMTTVHSVTNDQRILDLPHSDMRRARAAFESIIPTSTGAAVAVGLVLPELKGKLDGFAMRVPTRNVSVVDLTVHVEKGTTKEDVNNALRKAADGPLKNVLAVSDEPLVSIDYTGNPHSSTVDAELTEVIGEDLVKVVSWYDNEWGYSSRCLDLAGYIAQKSS